MQAEIVTLCWSIWIARNDLVWNQKTSSVLRTVAAAKQYLTQWNVTQCMSFVTPLQPHVEGYGAARWVKPQPNKVKVSVDATVFEDRGGVGFGMVARNCEGELIEARSLFHPHLVSPLAAESMAFKEALSWMDDRGWHVASVECDYYVMVQAIQSTVSMKSYFGLIIEDCHCMLQRLNKIDFFYVKRSANMVAHHLARESYYLSGRIIDRKSVPVLILNCISADLSP